MLVLAIVSLLLTLIVAAIAMFFGLPHVTAAAMGLSAAAAIYIVVLAGMRSSTLIQNGDNRVPQPGNRRMMVLSGYSAAHQARDISFNTSNPYHPSYAAIQPSRNGAGAVQFSYSFWMRVTGPAAGAVNRTLLLKGDARTYHMRVQRQFSRQAYDAPGTGDLQAPAAMRSGALLACPRIALGSAPGELVVDVNTLADPLARVVFSPKTMDATVQNPARANLAHLMANKWVLHTVTFEDDHVQAGARVRYFINDQLYHTAALPSSLRMNAGDLFVLPSLDGESQTALDSVFIGNIMYANYAMCPESVASVFALGPPTKLMSRVEQAAKGQPMHISEYNRMDIYNT